MNEAATEAAMCIWEYALHSRVNGDESVFNWLGNGDGASVARQTAIDIASQCEHAYQEALAAGYDDLFDWEFVPKWVRIMMALKMADIMPKAYDEKWDVYIGRRIYYELRLEHK